MSDTPSVLADAVEEVTTLAAHEMRERPAKLTAGEEITQATTRERPFATLNMVRPVPNAGGGL